MKIHAANMTSCLRWLVVPATVILLGACATGQDQSARPEVLKRIQPAKSPVSYVHLKQTSPFIIPAKRPKPAANLPKPLLAKIVVPQKPLQCVPYARELSNIQIRGDAWTWWAKAGGRYPRSAQPRAGAVMVLKKKNANSLGHVAYVEEVIDSRKLVVSHSNWLNEGRLHNNMPVIDVSKANDWSAVRFWNAEGGHYGGNVYHPYGFIHQNMMVASR